jgi:hypothetical protein
VAAEFASDISGAKIRVLSEGGLPSARRVSAEELASGIQDRRRVEVDGVVRSADGYEGGLMLNVTAGAVQFKAYVPQVTSAPANQVDARVRIRGTCSGFYNAKEQFISL